MVYNDSAAAPQINKQPLLTISIVTFNPNFDELKKTLGSLKSALNKLAPDTFSITIIDNSFSKEVASFLLCSFPELRVKLIQGQGNIGFGRAHNLAMQQMGEFHLILNPDIILYPDALLNAVSFMRTNEHCGLLSPSATWPNGQRQYLCKRYPAVFDLILRGFAPRFLRSLFSARLERYELQAETQSNVFWNPPIVSGCFMFFRSTSLKNIGGFNDRFFLYFEDFDLSLRSQKISSTAYVPAIRVIHAGGHASKKGWWHIKVFILSAMTFYRIHGVKLF
ncbi:glycosyl transferase [Ochrobactrum sp. 30A/1000/2015]|nr:glycosyl transferase [Ochrobactrum sp. 30A/1000/2015]PJT38247.1 glycosyl transferase [Ochrobactrum sp. 27A/999/2015]PJT41778.1 glycosyl transferase [Ochrobactrum sp. 23A/997/2015]